MRPGRCTAPRDRNGFIAILYNGDGIEEASGLEGAQHEGYFILVVVDDQDQIQLVQHPRTIITGEAGLGQGESGDYAACLAGDAVRAAALGTGSFPLPFKAVLEGPQLVTKAINRLS